MFALLLSGGLEIAGIHSEEFVVVTITASVFLLLIGVSRIIFHQHEITVVPESAITILIGVIFGLILWALGLEDDSVLNFNPEIFFVVLIPPIIFESGYNLNKVPHLNSFALELEQSNDELQKAFFDNMGTILVYALLGTLLATLFISLSTFGCSYIYNADLSLAESFVFGSLISAVDPVAVLAIFEEVHVNPTLNILVFGESVLNDAISIVLYRIFLALLDIDGFEWYIIFIALVKFLYVAFGGLLMGVLWACLGSFLTKFTHHLPLWEPLILGVCAFLSYLCAELFTMSGIVAILFCGIVVSRYAEQNLSSKSRTTFGFMVKLAASTADTTVFMYLGVATVFESFLADDLSEVWDPLMIIFTIIFITIYRFGIVYVMTYFLNKQRLKKIPLKDQFIVAYGGLRGAIAFALAFLLEEVEADFEDYKYIVTTTLAVIWWTIFIQGATIKPILNVLSVRRAAEEKTVRSEALPKVIDFVMPPIEALSGHQGILGWRRLLNWADSKLQYLLVRGLFTEEKELLKLVKQAQKGQDATGDELQRLMAASRLGGMGRGDPREDGTPRRGGPRDARLNIDGNDHLGGFLALGSRAQATYGVDTSRLRSMAHEFSQPGGTLEEGSIFTYTSSSSSAPSEAGEDEDVASAMRRLVARRLQKIKPQKESDE